MKQFFKILITIILVIVILACTAAAAVNAIVIFTAKGKIQTMIEAEQAGRNAPYDCILVLGCGVRPDGTPSPMLNDRVETAVTLYKMGVSSSILMSGDHDGNYNEVKVMTDKALGMGVPASAVFTDEAGFSTYDSIYRVKEVFHADRILIVSQRFHLRRALYIAGRLGLKAGAVSADLQGYAGYTYSELRELAARCKDFYYVLAKKKPGALSEVPINSAGINNRN